MANKIIEILMERDELSKKEATDLFRELRDRLIFDGEDPEVLLHEIGLEPDYIMDLI